MKCKILYKLQEKFDLDISDKNIKKINSSLYKIIQKFYCSGKISFDKENNKFIEGNIIEKSLGFEDIAIVQKKQICNSRLETDISSEIIKGIKIKIPLIAANMSTVCNSNFCIKLNELGALGVLHRASSNEDILKEIKLISNNCEYVAASIGITKDQYSFYKEMINAGCNILFIDVAHGYCDPVIDLAKNIKKYNKDIKVVIGNTTNIGLLHETEGVADCIKVGIAQGYACETKNTAGCTEKQFSAVLKFKEESKRLGVPIISDGGIREPADFVKAIAAGANSIMAGKIFAECPESAAEEIVIDGKPKKIYAGMASFEVQCKWKGGLKKGTCSEGGIRYLDLGLPVSDLLERYSGALRSGITYSGAKDIKSFQENVEFIRL